MSDGSGFRLVAIIILCICIFILTVRIQNLKEEVQQLRTEWNEFLDEISLAPEEWEDMTFEMMG